MPVTPWFREFRDKGERSTRPGEHVPVLLNETLAALDLKHGQIVVDCTLGFAGHAVEMLRRIGPTGKLIAFDADPTHLAQVEAALNEVGHPFQTHRGNFAAISSVLASLGVEQIDGLLADLGVSSMQLDDPTRGFSFMRDGPLDMRMDPGRGQTAAEILNTFAVEDLADAFRMLGNEPDALRIAEAIERERMIKPFSTTGQLKDLILCAAPVAVVKSPGLGPPERQKMRPTVRVFQALRMLVNRETGNLQQLLRTLPAILKPGGRAAIIAFHSGEDRLVKAAFKDGAMKGLYPEWTDEPIRPSEDEKAVNPRARSAKLRWVRRS